MNQKIKKLSENFTFENIFMFYIVLQPIIDIITSICIRNISQNLTFGIFIRAIFMLYVVIYTVFKTEKKDRLKLLIYYSCIVMYCIVFLLNSYSKYGFTMIVLQAKGLLKTFYFPIIFSGLLILFKNKTYLSNQKHLNISLTIYVLTIVICKIFSKGYKTYPLDQNAGTMGLFYAGNEISAIIAILAPICFSIFISKEFNVLNAILCAFTVFAMLEIGTKVAFIAIIGLIALSLVVSFIKLLKKENKDFYKHFITLLLISILTFLFVGNTAAGKNLNIKTISFKKNVDISQSEELPDLPEENNVTPTVLLSGRNEFFKKSLNVYNSGSVIDKFTGIGYILPKNSTIQERKLVEIDYFDIFFCHGVLGILIYVIPLAVFIVISSKKFLVEFVKNIKNNTLIFIMYSVAIAFGIALMAGHVFTAPAVSMFLILSMLEILKLLNCEKDIENE